MLYINYIKFELHEESYSVFFKHKPYTSTCYTFVEVLMKAVYIELQETLKQTVKVIRSQESSQ